MIDVSDERGCIQLKDVLNRWRAWRIVDRETTRAVSFMNQVWGVSVEYSKRDVSYPLSFIEATHIPAQSNSTNSN